MPDDVSYAVPRLSRGVEVKRVMVALAAMSLVLATSSRAVSERGDDIEVGLRAIKLQVAAILARLGAVEVTTAVNHADLTGLANQLNAIDADLATLEATVAALPAHQSPVRVVDSMDRTVGRAVGFEIDEPGTSGGAPSFRALVLLAGTQMKLIAKATGSQLEGLTRGWIWYETSDCSGQPYADRAGWQGLTPAGRLVAQNVMNGSTLWVASGANATIDALSSLDPTSGACKTSASRSIRSVKGARREIDLGTFTAPFRFE